MKFKIFKKKKKKVYMRFWDFSFANKFLKEHRNEIVFFELAMFNDREVHEVFVKNGNTIQDLGFTHQMGSGKIDGTLGSHIDIPAMHIIYKGGNEEWIACYLVSPAIERYSYSHRKLM